MIHEWILTILSLTGVVANIYKKRWCFIVWAVTNFSWMIVDYRRGIKAQAALFAIYFLLALWGLYKWTKDNKTKDGHQK